MLLFRVMQENDASSPVVFASQLLALALLFSDASEVLPQMVVSKKAVFSKLTRFLKDNFELWN